MSTGVFAAKNGRVWEAVGLQPKEALLFAPAKKGSAQLLREQRDLMKHTNRSLKDSFARATKR